MKWASAVSESNNLREAISESCFRVTSELGGLKPDLVMIFPSSHYDQGYELIPQMIRFELGDCIIFGCSGTSVMGAGREIEYKPGFAMIAGSLPGVELTSFHIENNDIPDGDDPPNNWENLIGIRSEKRPDFVILADPFSIQVEKLLMGLDFAFPHSTKVGGLASGGRSYAENALYVNSNIHRSGAIGLALHGNVVLDTIVSQGCRPIGKVMQVTKCEGNELIELNEQTPFEALKEMFTMLSDRDKELIQHSLFLGIVMDELRNDPQLGDFLIRNIVEIDPRTGTLKISELLKEGQTVQFHLRDADTSSKDLRSMLTHYKKNGLRESASSALLFQCLGRGSYLYGKPNHDTLMFKDLVGDIPLAGFFCNGEIGPVSGYTYLHGYTSAYGIFKPKLKEAN